MIAVVSLSGGPRTEASAQVVAICETALGARTTSQITAELEQAGYPGPWDLPAQIEAYARASGGPATCGGSSRSGRATTVVLLIAGYGSDLTSASVVFSALQSELLARDPTTSFAFFSYRGSDVRGCASVPTPYSPADTAQSLDASVAVFITTLQALQSACPADITVVGHSLGGLIAFHALSERPNARVKSVMTVDSPLGGAPLTSSTACIQLGFCADGPVVQELGWLYDNWSATAAANVARQANLVAVDTRLSAWGNDADCLYFVSLCSTVADGLAASVDARATQWLSVASPVHKNYAYAPRVWNIPASHTAVLENAAAEMATDLLP